MGMAVYLYVRRPALLLGEGHVGNIGGKSKEKQGSREQASGIQSRNGVIVQNKANLGVERAKGAEAHRHRAEGEGGWPCTRNKADLDVCARDVDLPVTQGR
jgi:hypothetical protein